MRVGAQRVSIPMLSGMAFLAVLSIVEAVFPRLKWLTFPAMIIALTGLIALFFFYRMKAWVGTAQWLRTTFGRDRDESQHDERGGPIEPK